MRWLLTKSRNNKIRAVERWTSLTTNHHPFPAPTSIRHPDDLSLFLITQQPTLSVPGNRLSPNPGLGPIRNPTHHLRLRPRHRQRHLGTVHLQRHVAD